MPRQSHNHHRLIQIGLMWSGAFGPAGFHRLLTHFGGLERLLDLSAQDLSVPSLRLEQPQVQAVLELEARLEAVEARCEALSAACVSVLCDFEPTYPAILGDLSVPPPVLCMAGSLLPLDDPAVAIVGTRSPTPEGRDMAYALGKAFAREQVTVVSGLARGCDTAAHSGALEGTGRTIAVLGSGILNIRPRENTELARRIAEQGCVLSELPPDAEPTIPSLMARNRLTSVLSRGVVVVQSAVEGGSMATVENARGQGRAVYAISWPEPGERVQGNIALLAAGAQELAGPGDAAHIARELFVTKERTLRQRAEAQAQMRLF